MESITPKGMTRYAITGADVAELLAELRDKPGIHEATIFGEAVHMMAEDDVSLESLHQRGYDIRPTQANLEDVFVTLARAQSRIAQGAQR